MIWILAKIGVMIYIIGFMIFFAFNLAIGPVTAGLALYRAFVWPYFWVTGKPRGEQARIIGDIGDEDN
jgi:hypothetical protein